MSNNTTTKQKMKYTADIREAIKINHAERCEIKIDNSVSSDLYGDDYCCVINSKYNNVTVTLDNESFIITVSDTITKIPITAISDINYLYDYDNDCCYLYFCIERMYDVNICFYAPE